MFFKDLVTASNEFKRRHKTGIMLIPFENQ